jgi:hypothetical protein
MKLIQELVEDVQFITEGSAAEKKYFIEGPFLQSNIANKNKRYYPEHIMDKEVGRYVQEFVEQRRAFGELGHPTGPIVNLDRASHMITSLVKEGTNYVGKAKITATPMGNIVKSLLDEGAKLGVSSRGLGSLKLNREGVNEVQEDFYLATAADIVADPSAPDAFVRGIMEGKDWMFMNGKWQERDYDQAKQLIEQANRRQMQEIQIRLFEQYLNTL